jgi:hypothetical protein
VSQEENHSTTPPIREPIAVPDGGRRNRYTLIICLLLMLAAWVEYLPSLQYGFVYYDDVRLLRDHPELYGNANLSADFKAIFSTYFPREEPLLLRDVTWAIDSRIFGFGNPFGYHLGNVLLHGVVVALMYVFLLGTTQRRGFAVAVAIVYLILGLHTEPVVWIMGRKDILATFFMLLALCAQTRRLATMPSPVWYGWYFLTLAAFACGALSKINVLTFPLVLILHAMLLPYLQGEQPENMSYKWFGKLARELALSLPALAFSAWNYVWYSRTLGQMGLLDRGYAAHGLAHLWNLLMMDPLVVLVYLQQTFFPCHLTVFYTWPALRAVYPAWHIAFCLGTFVTIFGIGFWLFRRHKDLFFYFATFFILMAPYLNLKFMGFWVAERYSYFSTFCPVALAVMVCMAILHHAQPVVRAIVVAVALWAASMNLYQTCSYQRAWRNGETLWQYHILLPQPSPDAYENLAAYFYAQANAQDNPQERAKLFQKVSVVVEAGFAQFWPDRQQPPPPQISFLFFLRSLIEEIRGEPAKALDSLLMSDRLHPQFDSTELNLARLYHKLAGLTTDRIQQQNYSVAARDRFLQYIDLAYHRRTAPPDVQQELQSYEVLCSATNPPIKINDKTTGP